jgi:hypothetical protein
MKALGTHYDGHHFRSRAEARWARFFNALNIEYHYETEGYAFEGIAYLPDFYLPRQDCFVEIKGQESTEEERKKTRLLALYTGKHVHTLYGSVWIPGESGAYQSYCDMPPKIWSYSTSGSLGDATTRRVTVPAHVLVMLQKLHDVGIEAYLEGRLILEPTTDTYTIEQLEDYLETLRRQQTVLAQLAPLLKIHEEDIVKALTPDEGCEIDLMFQREEEESWGGWWQECTHCGVLEIGLGSTATHICQDGVVGTLQSDTPHLVAAYTAARSARFEFGEKG